MMQRIVKNGRIRQSVCRWCFEYTPIEELAAWAAAAGLVGIDLVEPADWPVLKKHGLICTMTPTHTIEVGLNKACNHAACLAKIRERIDLTADAGFPNVICFSGNREQDLCDEDGLNACADAIGQIVGHAEKRGINLIIELLNSKVDHPGYMCDRSDWGGKLVRKVGSPRFKMLFDIYHMQVQEGDVIASIRKHADAIGHYHTAGVPGRHEIDETQELHYPAIMREIVETGYRGIVAQEFVPTKSPLESLAQAVAICDV